MVKNTLFFRKIQIFDTGRQRQ